jgi:hypothetical protein
MIFLNIFRLSLKSLIITVGLAYLPAAFSQSAKVSNYAQQGINAQANGDFKLACENFEIASNFAKGEDAPNYQQLLAQKNSACSQEARRLERIKANDAKNSNVKILETTGSLSDIISNANFYLGKKITVRCSSLYVSSSGQAVSCDSNGLSIWVDTRSLINVQYKKILENCISRDCSLCAVGDFSKSSNSFILNRAVLHTEMFGSCFASRY